MIVFYLIVIVFLILFPSDTADTALHAMRIWGTSIVPVLFPYMIFSRLLCKSLQTLSLPAAPAAAVLGMLGGSPSGASMIVSNADRLQARSIPPLCALTGTVSPMFILGTMQLWINDPLLCRRLLLYHWLSALLCSGIVWSICRQRSDTVPTQAPTSTILSNPIAQSIDAILQVGGCIICYSVLAGILERFLVPLPGLQPCIHALLEISGGVYSLCQSSLTDNTKYILISASLGFGGLSILSQNYALLRPLGVTMRQLFGFAALRAGLSALLMIAGLFLQSII